MGTHEPSEPRRGWGPFTGRQLTVIACVAVVSLVVIIPTAALAATGVFTSTTVTPAVTGTNSAAVPSATGVQGLATGTGDALRFGVIGSARGAGGIGVRGNGTAYGVFSNGPLGIAAGKPLVCTGCVKANNIANRITFNYDLAPGATSTPVTLPPDVPLQVMGIQNVVGFRGVASATLFRSGSSLIEWVGLESTNGSVITQGLSGTQGTHILFLDYPHLVDIEVNSPTTIRVNNTSAGQRSGTVVITW